MLIKPKTWRGVCVSSSTVLGMEMKKGMYCLLQNLQPSRPAMEWVQVVLGQLGPLSYLAFIFWPRPGHLFVGPK